MQIRLVNINPLLKENCTTYGSNVYDNVNDSRLQDNVIILPFRIFHSKL